EQMTLEEIRSQFLNYEERREKLKLLYIELLNNKEQLATSANVADGSYSLVTLDSSVIDRLLVDVYSIILEDTALVRALLTLRQQIRVINTRANIFFSQMALSYTPESKRQMANEHTAFLRQRSEIMAPLIDEALQTLETRFGLQNPLA